MQDGSTISVEDRVVVFMDIHNYSIAVSTMEGPQHSLLQEFYEQVGDVVVHHGGEILKYLGDAMLCIFPAGGESAAVDCALESRQVFASLVEERSLPPDTELEFGIGSGKVEIGIFGHRSLLQKDAFGEEINRTAMIGHHRGVAVTESVYHAIKASHETSPLPDRQVKWQDEPVRCWEVFERKEE